MADPYKDIVPRLKLDELRKLVKLLPEPHKKIVIGSYHPISADIYLVKNMFSDRWENEVLTKLLLHARGSFYIYSELPPLDIYDLKSQIYLTRIRYNDFEEWVSVKFIPYYGYPLKFRDIEMFEYRRKTIEYWIKKRLLDTAKLDWDSVVSGSGLCGIEPFSDTNNFISPKLLYTSLAFALMVAQFMKSYGTPPPAYLIVQAPEEFVENVLTFQTQNKTFPPNFTLASVTLSIKKKNQVKLRRDNSLIYDRPTYFFNRKILFELLRTVIEKNILTSKTFEYYMGNPALADELLKNKVVTASKFSKLGKIFTANGTIYGSKITGDELRNMLKKVPDGPQLRIIKVKDLLLSFQKMLDAANESL